MNLNQLDNSFYNNLLHFLDQFTLNGQIPLFFWYRKDLNSDKINWSNIEKDINMYTIENIKNNKITEPYQNASLFHVHAIQKYFNSDLSNKKIAVIGSITPWIESILINMKANNITTVEYNVPYCDHLYIKTVHYDDFKNSNEKYDIIFSYSSIEHSGLGRYGDPINPFGDIETMDVIYNKLENNGYVFLGIPVGKDSIVYNVHRVYGPIRLNMLLKKFQEIEWIGIQKDLLNNCQTVNNGPQPLIVLKKNKTI